MPVIALEGFENAVRNKLGVKPGELPNDVINSRLIVDLAENQIIKRVPAYTEIVDVRELLFLEGAVISYMCYLLAPSMPRRLNLEVTAIDTKWKKDKVNWLELAQLFLGEVDSQLSEITSVPVDEDGISASLVAVIQPEGTRIV